ncbi:Mrp-type sodium/proton antiporter system subunit D2 [Natronomonas pharaonis DSM 2160]|uniref:Mrp-type sodium/proton antiporter system subunit D2 n=1 Tax=Natronomonas pharaonis (strain ATCC 35678 / DSM 2160 / CIP 103997 / JCM 8858 / NBRC 14720 / NCIMB 2260 / Gabara) TaxID=348780 RepID=A0A1U7EU82_NATPD|nr:Na(+)/H(+) antiporter subunit D [Natronomonas pharaonis]CAI48505.1 Mrp-type sodium/proton antiporter system subunit D2 [Natronomonas pharaonis DSM 2160]
MNELLSVPPTVFVIAAALVVPFVSRRIAHGVSIAALVAVVGWALLVPDGIGPTYTFMGLDVIVVSVDDFSRLMAIIFGGFGAAAVAWAYFADTDNRHLLWGLAYVGASLWTVTVGDWLGLVVGWEVMAIASTVFVWLSGGAAVRAGYRYAIAHAIGGSLLLAGVVLYLFTADPSATALHFDGTGISGAPIPGTEISLAAVLAGVGIGVNTAMIGLHSWLPDTYPRPHVATSVFLCCYTTKSAVYAAYRAFPDGNVVLAFVGAAMAIYGAGFALAQKDMRRLLSYHIQSQVGIMLAGIGVGSALGIAGAFAHLFNHILYKGLLFMAAGILILQLKENRLNNFGAIGTSAPIALVVFLVGAMSISGVPGFNGFISKGMVMDAADYDFPSDVVIVGDFSIDILFWMIAVGSMGTFASFIKFGYYAFLDGEPIDAPDANLGHAVVAGAVAAACVVFGVYYQALVPYLPMAGGLELSPYSLSHLLKAGYLAGGGIAIFVLGKPIIDRLHGGFDVDQVYDPAAFYGVRSLSGGLGGLYNRVDGLVVGTGWRLVGTVHEPSTAIRGAIPESWQDAYDRRYESTPGKTGGKLGIGLTIYVAAGVLTVALAIALFI